jgi:hypothetical protein
VGLINELNAEAKGNVICKRALSNGVEVVAKAAFDLPEVSEVLVLRHVKSQKLQGHEVILRCAATAAGLTHSTPVKPSRDRRHRAAWRWLGRRS